MQDPFASAPVADEAQAETPQDESVFDSPPEDVPAPAKKAPAKKAPAKKAAGTVKVDVQPNVLPVQTEGKVVLTFKGGTGFDDPWIVIHATDLQDAYEQVTGENAQLLADLMRQVQAAGKHFASQGSPGAPKTSGRGGNTQQRSNAPQAAQEAPNGEKRYCAHGEMRFKSGVSKAGKPYSAFFCTSGDRNDECKAQFLR